MAGFSIDLRGDKEFQRFLRKAGSRADDLTTPLKAGGKQMLASIAENFARQGRPRWADLAPETWERKLERKHDKILIDSGRLKRSVVYRALPGALKIGTNVVYARIQQLGRGPYKRGPKVGRPFLVFHDFDVDIIRKEVMEYILGR